MELIVTPVPVPTTFGGTEKCMLLTFHDQTPLRRVEEMRADFVANASHELRTPLAALSGFIDTLQGPAKEDAKARERFLSDVKALGTAVQAIVVHAGETARPLAAASAVGPIERITPDEVARRLDAERPSSLGGAHV